MAFPNNIPVTTIAILSAKTPASFKWWVVKTKVLPYFLTFSSIYQINLLDNASMPLVGSSKNIIENSPINANANDNFLLFHPLKIFINLSLSYSNHVIFNISSISFSRESPTSPLTYPINWNISYTVKLSYDTSLHEHKSTLFLMKSILFSNSIPLINILPLVFSIKPVSILIVVVLPEPLCPNKNYIS